MLDLICDPVQDRCDRENFMELVGLEQQSAEAAKKGDKEKQWENDHNHFFRDQKLPYPVPKELLDYIDPTGLSQRQREAAYFMTQVQGELTRLWSYASRAGSSNGVTVLPSSRFSARPRSSSSGERWTSTMASIRCHACSARL